MSGIVSYLQDAYQGLVSFFSGIGQGIDTTLSSLQSSVSGFFSTIGNAIVAFGGLIYSSFAKFASDIYDAFKRVAEGFVDFAKEFTGGIRTLWGDVVKFFKDVYYTLREVAIKLYNAFRGFLLWVARLLVDASHEITSSLDSFLHGMWCTVRNKLATIVAVDIAEAGIYGIVKSATSGGLRLDQGIIKQLLRLGLGVMGMPAVGYLAGAILDSFLPPCTPKVRSLFGTATVMPESVAAKLPGVEELSKVTGVTTVPGEVASGYDYPVTVSLTVSTPMPVFTQVTQSFAYAVGYSVRFFPGRVVVPALRPAGIATITSYLAVRVVGAVPVFGTASFLAPTLTYRVFSQYSPYVTASLESVLTYALVTPGHASASASLASAVAYSLAHGSSASGSASLGSSLTYRTYFGAPVSGSASLASSLSFDVLYSYVSASASLSSSIAYDAIEGFVISASALITSSISHLIPAGTSPSASAGVGSSLTYSVSLPVSASASARAASALTYSISPNVSASASSGLSSAASYVYIPGFVGSASSKLTASVTYVYIAGYLEAASAKAMSSLTFKLSPHVSASASTKVTSALTYRYIAGASASASTKVTSALTYRYIAGASASASARASSTLTYSYSSPPPPESASSKLSAAFSATVGGVSTASVSASASVTTSGEAVDPATAALMLPTPDAVSFLYNVGAQKAADILMSIVARGSPSPAYGLLSQLAATYGANYAQSVLHAAASSLYFSPLIMLMTFNQPTISLGGSYAPSGPIFASQLTGSSGFQETVSWGVMPSFVVAQYVNLINFMFVGPCTNMPYGACGYGQVQGGAGGWHTFVFTIAANSVTLLLNGGLGGAGINSSAGATGSPYSTSCPSTYITPYAGLMLLAPSMTPGKGGNGGCCGNGCANYNGGGGGGTYNCGAGYGGWYINSGNCCSCLTTAPSSPNEPCSMEVMYFSSVQDLVVYLVEAITDYWLMHYLNATPSSPIPWPMMSGTGGGGSAGAGAGGGGGGGGEGIVVCYNCSNVTVNVQGGNGGNAYSSSNSGGAGGGGGGGVGLIVYSASNSSPAFSTGGGSAGGNNASSCGIKPTAGYSGTGTSVQLTWATPPYVTPATVSWSGSQGSATSSGTTGGGGGGRTITIA